MNPYNGGRPVTGEKLIGREDIVNEIYNALVAGTNYGIAGLHRIGKTSIGKEVLRRIREKHPEIRCAYVTVGTERSEAKLYQQITDELFPDAPQAFEPELTNDPWREFRRYMRSHSEGQQCVCVLDELDRILDFEDTELLISRLRSVAHDVDIYNTSFLFISARTLLSIEQKFRGSNLTGICHPKTIGPFRDKKNLEQMLEIGALPVSLAEPLFEMTGGHPYWSEMLLRSLVAKCQKLQRTADEELLREVLDDCSCDLADQYRQLEEFLNDWTEGSWNKLCDYTVGPQFEPVDEDLWNYLESYGLIHLAEMEWGWAISKHMKEYMVRNRQKHPVWPMIGEIEHKLRELIKKEMKERHGDDWTNTLQSDNPFVFGELLVIMRKEQAKLGKGSIEDILEYAYIGTLKDFVLHKWKIYRNVFDDLKEQFESNMNAICAIRNPLAHNRSPKLISRELKDRANYACNSVLAQLNKYFNEAKMI